MPHVKLSAGEFYYRYDGPADAPLLVLSNSLGTDHSMWDPQIPAFTKRFRVLRYDSRGHGASVAPPGPYAIADLGQDVLDLYRALGITRAHYCGVSMGGMVGMWLAANAPEDVDRLVLCNTAARLGPPQLWDARIEAIRLGGMPAIVSAVLVRWFTAPFLSRPTAALDHMRQVLSNTSAEGYIACCEAIRDMDLRAILRRIQAKSLVIAGELDAASPPADGRFLSSEIAGASYIELAAAHMTNIEAAEVFTQAVIGFLTDEGGAA
jgi:3-oxoadipate enol-lactonase